MQDYVLEREYDFLAQVNFWTFFQIFLLHDTKITIFIFRFIWNFDKL